MIEPGVKKVTEYQVVPLTVPVIMMGVAFSLIPAGMAWRPSRHELLRGTGNENE